VSLEEREARIWALLDVVPDPEIPVLSITDLGIVRAVRTAASGECVVALTPTYSGCPASQAIRESVRAALDAAGHGEVRIEEVLVPAWSSQWLSERGRERLREFGIAPPEFPVASVRELRGAAVIACPRCGSPDSERLSEFGSTPCKAHYRCNACREPFDYFKCI
jgi:ring-1,2-phenylacetyl-CoA epoxidase subunit PaaD